MKRLDGKSALITGSARGIGRGFAEAYVREGATVAIADINLEAAEATAAEIGSGSYAVQIDVSDQTSIDQAVAAVVAKAGKIDILINNAALFDAAEVVDITRQSFDKLYSVNVAGTLFTMQAAAKQMIAQGQGGKIEHYRPRTPRQYNRRGKQRLSPAHPSQALYLFAPVQTLQNLRVAAGDEGNLQSRCLASFKPFLQSHIVDLSSNEDNA